MPTDGTAEKSFPAFSPTVPELLRKTIAEHPDASVIVHGDRQLTYADLERESADLAKGMLSRGIGKGTRVGIWMPFASSDPPRRVVPQTSKTLIWYCDTNYPNVTNHLTHDILVTP